MRRSATFPPWRDPTISKRCDGDNAGRFVYGGIVARSSVRPRDWNGGAKTGPLIEAKIPAGRYRVLEICEGDMLLAHRRHLQVFLNPTGGPLWPPIGKRLESLWLVRLTILNGVPRKAS
jgi:hypothetical protein